MGEKKVERGRGGKGRGGGSGVGVGCGLSHRRVRPSELNWRKGARPHEHTWRGWRRWRWIMGGNGRSRRKKRRGGRRERKERRRRRRRSDLMVTFFITWVMKSNGQGLLWEIMAVSSCD